MWVSHRFSVFLSRRWTDYAKLPLGVNARVWMCVGYRPLDWHPIPECIQTSCPVFPDWLSVHKFRLLNERMNERFWHFWLPKLLAQGCARGGALSHADVSQILKVTVRTERSSTRKWDVEKLSKLKPNQKTAKKTVGEKEWDTTDSSRLHSFWRAKSHFKIATLHSSGVIYSNKLQSQIIPWNCQLSENKCLLWNRS